MQVVVDRRVRTHDLHQFCSTEFARAVVVALLQFSNSVAGLPLRDERTDRHETGPSLEVDLRAAGGRAAQLHHRRATEFIEILESVLGHLGIIEQIAHLLVQRGQIPVDCEQIIAGLLDDLGCDVALAAKGCHAHEQTLDAHGFEQLGAGGNQGATTCQTIAARRERLSPRHAGCCARPVTGRRRRQLCAQHGGGFRRTQPPGHAAARARLTERLLVLLILGGRRAVAATYLMGRKASQFNDAAARMSPHLWPPTEARRWS